MFPNPPSWRRIRPVLPHTDDDSIGSRRRLFGAAFLFVKPKPASAAIGLADPSSFAKTFLLGGANIRHIDGEAYSRGKRVRNSGQFARLIVGSVSVAVGGVLFGAAFADDFPLVGNYTQNVACKGDGSDQAIAKVTISRQEIISNVGVCTILDKKTNGSSISAHVECKFAGGPLIGDITFTPRPDNTVEFIDRDMTYKAVLYRCPQ
jgi:hypothetical protein